jgi:hypothetical protein
MPEIYRGANGLVLRTERQVRILVGDALSHICDNLESISLGKAGCATRLNRVATMVVRWTDDEMRSAPIS